jgi:hypothetical protein
MATVSTLSAAHVRRRRGFRKGQSSEQYEGGKFMYGTLGIPADTFDWILIVGMVLLVALLVIFAIRDKARGRKQHEASDDLLTKPMDLPIKERICCNSSHDYLQTLDGDQHTADPATQQLIPAPGPLQPTAKEIQAAANIDRSTVARLRDQKALDALVVGADPAKVAQEGCYKTVKYMKDRVRELKKEALPA